MLAEVLGISESRVYYILKNELKNERKSKVENKGLIMSKINEICEKYPAIGYRKVYAILNWRYGVSCHRNKVNELMTEMGLSQAIQGGTKKLFKGIPFSLKMETERSNQLWGIDMTYIWCGADAWCYFHGVIDHHDKTLLGYNFSRSCKAIGGVMALAEASVKRPVDDLELRSDNGCHYGSRVFQDELKRLGIRHTRTMVNTPKGNAVIERFFKSLKQECVWQHQFKNYEEAKVYIDKWIKEYNEERPHQSLKYLTPNEFYKKIPSRLSPFAEPEGHEHDASEASGQKQGCFYEEIQKVVGV